MDLQVAGSNPVTHPIFQTGRHREPEIFVLHNGRQFKELGECSYPTEFVKTAVLFEGCDRTRVESQLGIR